MNRGDKMNVMKLKGKIVEKGFTIPSIAKAAYIDRSLMYRKLKSERFTIGEARRIKEALHLTDNEAIEIFLS